MIKINRAILTGRLTRNPEERATASGVIVALFTVAVDRKYSKDSGQKADFIDVVAYSGTAEFVLRYFTKGQKIEIEGRLQTRTYEKDGVKRKVYEVIADSVDFGESKRAEKEPTPEETEADIDNFIPIDETDLPF